MADNKKEIIFGFKADTGDASAKIKQLNEQIDNLGNKEIDKPFKTFKAEIREATNEAKKMEEQFGRNSKQFSEAAQRVAKLKDRFDETNAAIKGFNPDNKLQALVNISSGAVKSIQGVTGAINFLGLQSSSAEEAIAKLQGLMAFSDALSSVDDIANGFRNFGAVIASTSEYQAANNALTATASGLMKLFGVSVEGSTGTLKAFKVALLGLGIGVVIAGIGVLVEHWDELKESLGFATQAQEAYNKTVEDYNKGAQAAAQKVAEVRSAFDLAREGVISKREALEKYNETLGDALGKTNDLSKAEDLVAQKADTFIKITGLKAQAQALFAASAAETAKALTANQEDQTSFLDKSKAFIANYISVGTGAAVAIEAQQKGVEDAVEKANAKATTLQSKAEELLKQAGELGKETGVNADVVDVKDELKKQDDTRRQKQKEQQEKDRLNRIEQEKITSKLIEDARLAAIQDSFFKQQASLAVQQQEELDGQLDLLNKKLIKDEEYRIRKKAIDDRYNQLQSALLIQKAKEDEEAALKAVADVHAGLIQDFQDNATEADTNLTKVKNENQPNENDDTATAIEKVNKIFEAIKTAEDANFELEKAKKLGQDKELENANQKHLEKLISNEQAKSDAIKEIGEKETEAKQAQFEAIRGLVTAAASLFSKHTVAYKAVAVANATIDTYQSAVAAYKGMVAAIPGPYGIAAGAVAAAVSIASGIANVKKILAVKTPGGGGGDTGSVPVATPYQAPQITATATTPQNIQDVRVTNQGEQKPIRTYITQKDLQDNERNTSFFNNVRSF